MKAGVAAGCVHVDARPLKAALAPPAAAARDRMRLALLALARRAAASALDDVGGRARALAARPEGLEGFASYLVRTSYLSPLPLCPP